MNKIFRSLLEVVLVMCLLPSVPIFAQAPDEGVQPQMTILAGGSVDIYNCDGFVEIAITTKALKKVEKVYHKITVYKNDVLQMKNIEYSASNKMVIDTVLTFNAKDGDIFEVIVDHYAKDGSITETKQTTTFGDYWD